MKPGICSMASTEFCRAQKDCYSCSHGRKVFQLLYEYEETGLDPKNMDHWQEMFLAECAGRLLITACKVGDSIYFILPDANEYLGYYVSEAHRVTEVGTRGFWTSAFPQEQTDAMSDFTPWSEMGKTAFLTKEKAAEMLAKDMNVPTCKETGDLCMGCVKGPCESRKEV